MAEKRVTAKDGGTINRIALCALLVMVVMACGVTAVTAECVTGQQWVEGVQSRSQGWKVAPIYDLSGDEAVRAVARLNAVPPVTDLSADHVLVLMAQSDKTGLVHSDAIVGFFSGGCLNATLRYDAASVSSWVNDPGEGV